MTATVRVAGPVAREQEYSSRPRVHRGAPLATSPPRPSSCHLSTRGETKSWPVEEIGPCGQLLQAVGDLWLPSLPGGDGDGQHGWGGAHAAAGRGLPGRGARRAPAAAARSGGRGTWPLGGCVALKAAAPRRATDGARPAAARGGCPRRPELAAPRAAGDGGHDRAGLGAGARVPGRRQPGGTAAHPAAAGAGRGGHDRGATGGRAGRGARRRVWCTATSVPPTCSSPSTAGRCCPTWASPAWPAGPALEAVTAAYADPGRARTGRR